MKDKGTSGNERTYLCFDLGTTRIKSALLGSRGNIIYLDSEKAVSYRDGDSVTQKPEEYFEAVENQIKKIAKKHKDDLGRADSLICSGQMAGILSVDRNWEVVMPWTYSIDARANEYLDDIENRIRKRIPLLIRKSILPSLWRLTTLWNPIIFQSSIFLLNNF